MENSLTISKQYVELNMLIQYINAHFFYIFDCLRVYIKLYADLQPNIYIFPFGNIKKGAIITTFVWISTFLIINVYILEFKLIIFNIRCTYNI